MAKTEGMSSFIHENKEILKEYLETRFEIYRLKGVKSVSKTAGSLAWIIVSLFLLFLVLIFAGMTLAYWLSGVFSSLVWGFGVTALIMVGLFVLLAIFRNALFINPVIRSIISKADDDDKD